MLGGVPWPTLLARRDLTRPRRDQFRRERRSISVGRRRKLPTSRRRPRVSWSRFWKFNRVRGFKKGTAERSEPTSPSSIASDPRLGDPVSQGALGLSSQSIDNLNPGAITGREGDRFQAAAERPSLPEMGRTGLNEDLTFPDPDLEPACSVTSDLFDLRFDPALEGSLDRGIGMAFDRNRTFGLAARSPQSGSEPTAQESRPAGLGDRGRGPFCRAHRSPGG